MGYLNRRNLSGATLLEVFQVGYSNGSLHRALPKSGDLIRNLKTLGVLNAKGQEHFRGCVTVPIFDAAGNVAGIYGRRVTDAEPRHLYLPGPHRGVFNGAAARTNQTLFITEAIFDGIELVAGGLQKRDGVVWRARLDGRPRATFEGQRHDRNLSVPWTTTRPARKRPRG